MEEIKIKVENLESNRLDLYLALNLNKFSRSEIKRLINEGQVNVNGNIEYRPHYKMKLGDEIILKGSLNGKETTESIIPSKMPLNIIYEDKDLLVLNKPAGMVTHPATGHQTDTLMNGVVYKYKELLTVGEKMRSGLIHRLDKDTSGIILIGKTNLGLWHYSRLFAEKKVEKTYIVVVKGNVSTKFNNGSLEIKSIHGRNKLNRKKYASQDDYDGRPALTEFKLIKTGTLRGIGYSLLHAIPKTGRTHQIRVHISELGFPVLGDPIYGNNEYTRLMLHAWKIKVKMVDGKEKTFEAQIPKEFLEFING